MKANAAILKLRQEKARGGIGQRGTERYQMENNGNFVEVRTRNDGEDDLETEASMGMGHMGASWLERPEREREERTDLLLSLLPIVPGDTVADIGAGSGYFTRNDGKE